MATINDIPPNLRYTPIGVEGTVEVNAHLVGGSLIDSLRRTFTIDSQMEQGDNFLDRSLELLERHLQLMQLNEQIAIRQRYMRAWKLKNELHSDDSNGSSFQRFLQARQYKCLSRKAYKIVKLASDRVRANPLINQLAEATRNGAGQASTQRNPFTDSHAVSTLSDVDVNNLDRVELSTYHEDGTNEGAVVLGLVGQDKSVQHVVATFPTEAFSGDRTGSGAPQSIASAPAGISLHRDDGTSPRLIAASLPDAANERADKQVDKDTLNSFAMSELETSKGNHPPPVPRAAVKPTDDPATCYLAHPRPSRR